MANRQQRRQGVVYGPVRPTGPGRDTGAIIGRILGLVVVVLAMGVLAVGAYIFLNQRAAAPTFRPTPTAVAEASPSDSPAPPTATATVSPPTLFPTAPPSLPATLEPTVAPTPVIPLVQIGPGFVTFGTRANDQLAITDPRSVFAPDERITWRARPSAATSAAEKLDDDAPSTTISSGSASTMAAGP
jgi:hypothetical protein